MSDFRMETKCVQAGYTPGNGEPRQIPIIQSTTFKYDTSEDMGKLQHECGNKSQRYRHTPHCNSVTNHTELCITTSSE